MFACWMLRSLDEVRNANPYAAYRANHRLWSCKASRGRRRLRLRRRRRSRRLSPWRSPLTLWRRKTPAPLLRRRRRRTRSHQTSPWLSPRNFSGHAHGGGGAGRRLRAEKGAALLLARLPKRFPLRHATPRRHLLMHESKETVSVVDMRHTGLSTRRFQPILGHPLLVPGHVLGGENPRIVDDTEAIHVRERGLGPLLTNCLSGRLVRVGRDPSYEYDSSLLRSMKMGTPSSKWYASRFPPWWGADTPLWQKLGRSFSDWFAPAPSPLCT